MMNDVRPDVSVGSPTDSAVTSESQAVHPRTRTSNLTAVAILLLIFLTPAFGFWWLRDMAREAMERNALSHTRDMLVRHIARSHGEWPASWDDLEPDFKPVGVNYGTRNLNELKRIVEVDFEFDPESIEEDRPEGDKPPRIIWLRNRSDTDDVRQVNARLLEILQHRVASRRTGASLSLSM